MAVMMMLCSGLQASAFSAFCFLLLVLYCIDILVFVIIQFMLSILLKLKPKLMCASFFLFDLKLLTFRISLPTVAKLYCDRGK